MLHNLGMYSNKYRTFNLYISMYSVAQANRIRSYYVTQINLALKSMIVF